MAIYNASESSRKKIRKRTLAEMKEEGESSPQFKEAKAENASRFRRDIFGSLAGAAAAITAGRLGKPKYDRFRKNKKELNDIAKSEKMLRRAMDASPRNTADLKRKQAQAAEGKFYQPVGPQQPSASTEKPSTGSIIKSRMESKTNADNFAERERLRLEAVERQRGAMQRAENTAALRKNRLQQAEQAKSDARSKQQQDAEQASQEEAANLRNDLANREISSAANEKAKERSRERLSGLRGEREAQQKAVEMEQRRNPNIASNPSSGRALKRDLRRQESQGKAADEAAEKAAKNKAESEQAEKNRQADLKRRLQQNRQERGSLKTLGEQIQNPDERMRAQIKERQEAELKRDQEAADEINKRISQNRLKRRLKENQQGRRSIESLGEQIKNPDSNMREQIKEKRDTETKARMQRLREYQAELRGKNKPEAPAEKESPATPAAPAAASSSGKGAMSESLIRARIARAANAEAKKAPAKKAPAKKTPVKKMNCGGSVKRYSNGGKIKRGDGICRVATRGTMR
jgi:hypothetical protein